MKSRSSAATEELRQSAWNGLPAGLARVLSARLVGDLEQTRTIHLPPKEIEGGRSVAGERDALPVGGPSGELVDRWARRDLSQVGPVCATTKMSEFPVRALMNAM